MPKKIDLTGQVFGRLTALEDVGRKGGGHILWRCQCSCGNFINVSSNALRRKNTQSCGCLQKEQVSERSYKDLVGQRFDRLTVLEDVGRTKRQQVIWRCLCECGNIKDIKSGSLRNGGTKSCGCLHKDRASEANFGENNHGWKGGVTPLCVAIRTCTTYVLWRTQIFIRDNRTCQHCHQVGKYLHAHHIIRFSKIMEEHNITTLEEALQCEALWDTNNGLTLCVECHEEEHARLRTLDIDL